MKFLLDSVILIDHFNNINQATKYINSVYSESAISVITRAEVLTGFDSPQRDIASQFLDYFTTLEMNIPIADLAAILRRQEGWKLPDAIQAAFAQTYQLILVTRNFRDFPPDRYNFVSIPYTIRP